MNISIQNDIKMIEMGDKGPNLLSVDRADKIISELSKKDCKAVILLGNEKVFSAGLNLKHLQKAKDADEVSLIFKTFATIGSFVELAIKNSLVFPIRLILFPVNKFLYSFSQLGSSGEVFDANKLFEKCIEKAFPLVGLPYDLKPSIASYEEFVTPVSNKPFLFVTTTDSNALDLPFIELGNDWDHTISPFLRSTFIKYLSIIFFLVSL